MRNLDPSGIHAAYVALERDGFVVLRPRRNSERGCYDIPVYPQRDLGAVNDASRKELPRSLRGDAHALPRFHALVDKWRSRHTSILFEDIPVKHDVLLHDVDWGAVVSEIWGHYHATLIDAASKGVSAEQLTRYDPEEKLAAQFPGFQPRIGGRIDMDIPFEVGYGEDSGVACAADLLKETVEMFLAGNYPESSNTEGSDAESSVIYGVNTVRHITDENGRFGLGCVISRPGDAVQNWHQDGDSLGEDRGKTFIAFMTTSRGAMGIRGDNDLGGGLPGPLQIIKGSHKVNAEPGLKEGELPERLRSKEVTEKADSPENKHTGDSYLFEADEPGTICVMNYRCWHRGLANTSTRIMRPMLYMRFEVKWGRPRNGLPRIYPKEPKRKRKTPMDDASKKRRVTPTQVS
mmetsp:Transcript_13554/g.54805  ORF Transcript_13554/g.54805 Transcript_13554/m.54805 type:complete len:405 (-) Transcript_13554:17-1231(-)